ncbi:hypothetical protein [Petrotoga olearia]|uniref:Uncharacterized protein n=2 Tax=Petrotoga olearia TaxID=156203 RepID=A0A2K1P3F8_9BACT|nr:hypothetical protein [Petrotoga olearia]PNR97304.1 hypothetical protein X929_03530 [Petrotoga olearia DSM 13574]RMA76668.1 hypothetical protein C8D75_0321 [Petrotoga olearia]
MKHKNFTLSLIAILSIIFMLLNIQKSFFYVFSFFVIFLVSIYGFSNDNRIWYHKSAHIVVSSFIGLFLFAYEILDILSNMLVGDFSEINLNIYVIIFGVLSILIFFLELRHLRRKRNEALNKE